MRILAHGLLCHALILSLAAFAEPPQTLVFLNWSEYMDPELVAEFEALRGVKVTQLYFESDDTRDQILVESKSQGYDLAMVNEVQLDLYRRRGWLAPLDPAAIPNLRHVDPRWFDAFPAAVGYAVPYAWGTLGIAYRADLIPKPLTRWMQLFRPDPALRGRILMHYHARDLISMALKALGYSANSVDPQELEQAQQLLLEQKPHVKSYSFLSLDESSALVSGEVVAAMMYSSDALMVQRHHPAITYVVPEEGGTLWVDYLAALEAGKNQDLAWAFMDFLSQPDKAAQLAMYLQAPTPNRTAMALLPEAFLAHPAVYPPQEELLRSEVYTALPPLALRLRNAIFADLFH